jgi:alkanesulfonate monooxygenase SsuD/methylene tetrahydromethanopterin reductase-like flavin-dependent oxidoreductase (luciferase family)
MAAEFVEVALRLWSSWEADAVVMDAERGFADHRKFHPIDFKGRFFASRGPLNTARPAHGKPVLVQAGSSPQGRRGAHQRRRAGDERDVSQRGGRSG